MVRVYLAEIPEEEAKTPAEAHARQSAAARRLLALALRRDYPEAAKALPIEKDEKGRPYLAGHEEIQISLSHSGSLAACAVGSRPVGVDVERWRKQVNRERIARRLHERERSWLEAQLEKAQTEEAREGAFFDLWVRKESFLKATGEGLRLRLDSFCTVEEETCPDPSCGERDGAPVRVRQHYSSAAFFIRQYDLGERGCSLAVCTQEEESAAEPVWISLEGEF